MHEGHHHPLDHEDSATRSRKNDHLESCGGIADDAKEFVMIDEHDVVESIAVYLAETLMRDPRAKDMQPKDLQRCLSSALADLRKTRAKRLWSWSKMMWKSGTALYGVFQLYANPWIMEAVLRVVWLSGRVCGAI